MVLVQLIFSYIYYSTFGCFGFILSLAIAGKLCNKCLIFMLVFATFTGTALVKV